MNQEEKLTVLLFTFIMGMVAFVIIYFGVLHIFDRMNSLSDVAINLDGIPSCDIDIPKPVGDCDELFVERNESAGELLLEGKNCSFSLEGNIKVSCAQRYERIMEYRLRQMVEDYNTGVIPIDVLDGGG